MFPELLEYMWSSFMMEGHVVLGVDSHVIHVDLKPLFWKHICADMVHESLKSGGSVAESEEHDCGFEEFHGGDEGGFPLIFLSDVNVVISPTNVELGEQGGFLHIINEFWNEREWIGVLDGVGVQVAVILAWTKSSILLWHKEEGRGLGRFQGYNSSCFKVFFHKGLACFHFCWIEGINFGDLGGEVRVKFDGVVIGTMRRELIVGFLGENICEVFAPIRYNRFSQLGGLGDLGRDGGLVDLFPI